MGYDLRNGAGAEFQFTNRGWRNVVVFAKAHGYVIPDDADELSATEARFLADAIERGMSGGSTSEIADRISRELTQLLVVPGSAMFPDHPIQCFARSVEYWREFIAFARRGGFSIRF